MTDVLPPQLLCPLLPLRRLLDYALPEDAAEDSFNILPVLLGEATRPPRPFLMHQTHRLELAIREGPWKYLDHPGSGGNNYASEKLAPLRRTGTDWVAPAQLYHLDNDPDEMHNLFHAYPEKVLQLKGLLEVAKQSGRTR